MEIVLLVIIVASFAAYIIYQDRQYKKTAYYQVTQNPYSSIKYDKGKHGEYLAYKHLQHFEATGGKFLFNILVPKWNNETTEIDMLLICSKGLFVFESKNYSGWIFGNEAHKNWTQTLPRGWEGDCHKERFYNPIMQNASHIKHLRRIVPGNAPMRSVIVFSDSCTLKNITVRSNDVRVVNCHRVASAVSEICSQTADFLTHTEIDDIYSKLYPYTQVSGEEREQHTNSVQRY